MGLFGRMSLIGSGIERLMSKREEIEPSTCLILLRGLCVEQILPLFPWSSCHEDRRSVDWDSLTLASLGPGGTKRVVRFVHQKASSEI